MLSTVFVGMAALFLIFFIFSYASKKNDASTEIEFYFEFAKIIKTRCKIKGKSKGKNS